MVKRVIVEIRVPKTLALDVALSTVSKEIDVPGFTIDEEYQPIPSSPKPSLAAEIADANEQILLIRGTIEEDQEQALRDNPRVVNVWSDARIEPFETPESPKLNLSGEAAASPCSPYDCASTVPKGNLDDVAIFLGAKSIWEKGYKGSGIIIGICDTGVRRSAVPANTLIGGWSPPGTTPWGDDGAHYHGTMCATDALGVCPKAKILDIGILKTQDVAGVLSDAIAAYDWALSRFRTGEGPHILSNSWGIYEESWAPDYARDPDHPFTRKVVEVIDAGILVCFAAGNCGEVCPSYKCRSDTGPRKSIWGANGHPKVITVGAANIRKEWIGYSSQGPAALADKKPDVCAPSHFQGYTGSDNGTSAACPTLAGVLGLLQQAKPKLRQDEAKKALQSTTTDICAPGWDYNSGSGIINAWKAFVKIKGKKICLIATAAYGSPQAYEVQRLRHIRDNELSSTLMGRKLVDGFESVYYLFSPFVARAMIRNKRLKDFLRKSVVTPIVIALRLLFDREGRNSS